MTPTGDPRAIAEAIVQAHSTDVKHEVGRTSLGRGPSARYPPTMDEPGAERSPRAGSTEPLSCVLLTVDGHHGDAAATFAARTFRLRGVARLADGAGPVPNVRALAAGEVDFLFSFLNPAILPPAALTVARRAAINFHPAPPRWPGVGCVSYALYHGDAEFGVTAHLMTETVDAGRIIRVLRFPVVPDDDNESLSRRAQDQALVLFYDVLTEIATTGEPPRCEERWRGPARTRAEFRSWMTVSVTDPADEIRRKVRAVAHPRWPGPLLEAAGYTFVLQPGSSAGTPGSDRTPT